MHVDEEQLQRLVDDELAEPVDDWAREHVVWCEACRDRVTRAKAESEELLILLQHLDHQRARPDIAAIAARATTREPRWMLKAAGFIVAAVLAGAAYAAPGSPLPALTEKIFGTGQSQRVAEAPPISPRVEPVVSGVTVAAGERLLILFASSQESGDLRIALGGDADVAVRATGDDASFTAGDELLTVGNEGSRASFEVVIPRTAANVEIRVQGERVFLKNGAAIDAGRMSPAGDGYVMSLALRH